MNLTSMFVQEGAEASVTKDLSSLTRLYGSKILEDHLALIHKSTSRR
jgi:hypothetical protein